MRTNIRDVIEKAGGSMRVAITLGITQSAVVQWKSRGKIPARYWQFLMDHAKVSLKDLFEMNQAK